MRLRFGLWCSILALGACTVSQPDKVPVRALDAQQLADFRRQTGGIALAAADTMQVYDVVAQMIRDTLIGRRPLPNLPPLRERTVPYMEKIVGGTFWMGSRMGDSDEVPVHEVSVGDFWLSRYEVTFADYDRYCVATQQPKPDDKGWGRGKRPVVNVSWYDALAYCNWLSEQHALQPVYQIDGARIQVNWRANGYRLPTEAEWEYAARGGAANTRWMGTSEEAQLAQFANYVGMDDGHPWSAPVGSYLPNRLGLYDMSGNVWEWCWDYWRPSYQIGAKRQPTGPKRGLFRVTRGGSWDSQPGSLRASNRNGISAGHQDLFIGFRLCRSGDAG